MRKLSKVGWKREEGEERERTEARKEMRRRGNVAALVVGCVNANDAIVTDAAVRRRNPFYNPKRNLYFAAFFFLSSL